MRSCRRYSRARSVFHESKTAFTARSSCSRGSCGNGRPACSSVRSWYVATRPRRSSAVELGVGLDTALGLERVERVVEHVGLDAEHGGAEHLHQAAVGVPGEPLVARGRRQPEHRSSLSPTLRTVSIMPGIENFAPDRTATSSGSSACPRLLAHGVLERRKVVGDLGCEPDRHPPLGEVLAAGVGADDEARWHRQAEAGHLGEVRALAAQQVLLVLVAFREGIHELAHTADHAAPAAGRARGPRASRARGAPRNRAQK